jgi:hypothetical protein
MAITSLSVTAFQGQSWNAAGPAAGADYNPTTNASKINKQQSLGNTTGANNTQLGGADEFVSYLITIAGSGNATVNLKGLTDILGNACSFARIKEYCIRLLSPTDDPVNGTNCSSISWGNAPSDQQNFNLSANGSMTVFNGGGSTYFDQSNGGMTVGSSTNDVLLINRDAGNAACVQLSFTGGST